MEIYLCSDCSEELLKNLPVFPITMQSYGILRQLVVPQRSLLTFPQFPQVLEEGVKLSMEALFFSVPILFLLTLLALRAWLIR